MRKIFSLILVLSLVSFFSLPVLAASQWYKIQGGQSYDLYHCAFYDQNVGWAVGTSGTALITLDGGSSWKQLTAPARTYTSVSVVSPLQYEAWITDSQGYIHHVKVDTNGNLVTWETTSQLTTSGLNDIFMTGQTDGFAVGSGGKIFRYLTTVWQPNTAALNFDYYGISSAPRFPSRLVAVGAVKDGLSVATARTLTTGASWDAAASIPVKTQTFRKVSYTDYGNVFTAGDGALTGGAVFKSTDDGRNWLPFNNGISTLNNFKDICFLSSTEGWTVGQNGIYYINTNIENDWQNVTPSTWQQGEVLYGVFAKDSNHAWAVGQGGSIYVYSATTPPSLLPASTEVTVINTFESVGLSWTTAAGASGYQLYRARKSEGTNKISDDFSGTSLDLTKWVTIESTGSYEFILGGGRLEITGTAASSGGDFAVGGVYGSNVSVNTAKLIEVSADIDLSHGSQYPFFATPALFSLVPDSPTGIAPYLGKGTATQYGVGALIPAVKASNVVFDTAASPSGNLKMLQAGNYSSVFFDGIYKGKLASNLTGISGLSYFLGGYSGKNISMDIFFDNYKAVEYPFSLMTSSTNTSFTDTSVVTGESYFYWVVPVNAGGYSSGSNIVEVTVTSTRAATTVTTVSGTASFQGGEINLLIHPNGTISISSSAVSSVPISLAVYGPNWSDTLDIASATSVKQSQTGDIQIKWLPTGKIANLDKGIYPAILRVGSINQKIYLIKY